MIEELGESAAGPAGTKAVETKAQSGGRKRRSPVASACRRALSQAARDVADGDLAEGERRAKAVTAIARAAHEIDAFERAEAKDDKAAPACVGEHNGESARTSLERRLDRLAAGPATGADPGDAE